MAKKKKKKANKSDGIWVYEEYPNAKTEVQKIIMKSWQDVSRADISFLLMNEWTTHRIQTHFSVPLHKVLYKIRFTDSYNTICKDYTI